MIFSFCASQEQEKDDVLLLRKGVGLVSSVPSVTPVGFKCALGVASHFGSSASCGSLSR